MRTYSSIDRTPSGGPRTSTDSASPLRSRLVSALTAHPEVLVDSNGSGEAAGQQPSSPSALGPDKPAGVFGGAVGEEDWQLKEDLMGAFEGALDVGGKRGDLRGIRVLKNDRVMGARAGGGPCFGNCEDDDGAEWVRSIRPYLAARPQQVKFLFSHFCLAAVYQITFQVKRVKKAKADGADGAADDSLNGESVAGGQSVLEISGPTIPSPGPSGVAHQRQTGRGGGVLEESAS